MEKLFKIRFNTDYPHVSPYPWRVIAINDDEWQQILTMHVVVHCKTTTSTDTMPDGKIKHHITLTPQTSSFIDPQPDGGYGKIEFW